MWRIIVSFFHVPLHVATHITCFSLPSTRPLFPTHRYDVNAIRQLLPQYMNDAGYTSHMIGKWHLGGHTDAHLPHRRGFETHLGYTFGAETYWTHQVRRDRDGKLSRNTRCVDRLLFFCTCRGINQPKTLVHAKRCAHSGTPLLLAVFQPLFGSTGPVFLPVRDGRSPC